MAYRVVSINPDGTAQVYTPIPADLPTAIAYAEANGGEVLPLATVDALVKSGRRLGADVGADGMRVGDFKLAIAGAEGQLTHPPPLTARIDMP